MDVVDNGNNHLDMSSCCDGRIRGWLTAQRSITVRNDGAYTDLTRSSISS